MRRTGAGFSLIELLVVVVIIGIFAGAAVLSLGIVGNDRDIEREVFRLQTLLELISEEAVLQNRDYGIEFSETGYRFYLYDPETFLWFEPANDRFLSQRTLDFPLSLGLTLEDREITLDIEFEEDEVDEPEPQVIVLASGEMTPFDVSFYRDLNGGQFHLSAEINGSVKISQEGFDAQ
jgi:general secretion pathway protein H